MNSSVTEDSEITFNSVSPRAQKISAQHFIDLICDRHSFIPWVLPVPVNRKDTDSQYSAELSQARRKTGLHEAVMSGEATIDGRRIAIIANEFDFLAGSVGVETAERVVHTIERATAERLPLIASPTSGGTRMQEGVVAFLQMVKISAAVTFHKKAGLPFLTFLRDPTFGGVFASWGSLAHVTWAQQHARIGFLGPRVYQQLNGKAFPPGIQTAENLYSHGVVDGVLLAENVLSVIKDALTVLCGDKDVSLMPSPSYELRTQPDNDHDVWASVQISRNSSRPTAGDIIKGYGTNLVQLSGTGDGELSSALLLYLARFGGYPCVVLGQQRLESSPHMGPGALREARRGMRIAAELNLPLILLIDTAGAALTPEAEERGLAGEIARSLADLSLVETATCSVLIGQGTGGGALALFPADVVLCTENAWLAPLPPEGASAVIYRDTEHSQEMAERQRIGSSALLEQGIVDAIIPEPVDPAEYPQEFIDQVGSAIAITLEKLDRHSPTLLRAKRLLRYRYLGL